MFLPYSPLDSLKLFFSIYVASISKMHLIYKAFSHNLHVYYNLCCRCRHICAFITVCHLHQCPQPRPYNRNDNHSAGLLHTVWIAWICTGLHGARNILHAHIVTTMKSTVLPAELTLLSKEQSHAVLCKSFRCLESYP